MSDVEIHVRPNGPFLVSGPAKLVDSEGNAFDLTGKEKYALCRCGASQSRPFCDGAHKGCGFESDEKSTAN